MKILITGATGSLGSRLVAAWKEKHECSATGRRAFQGPAQIKFTAGDLAEPGFCRKIVRGQDAVVHCAALASAWGAWEAFERANVQATALLAEACLAESVKQLVHLSTPSVYFSPHDRRRIREDDTLPPAATFYAKSKILADEIVRKASVKGLHTVMLRPRGIFGPTDQVILPKFLRVIRKGFFPLVRGGAPLIDLTYVDNLVLAMERCLERPGEINGEAINISNGEPICVRELVELIAAQLNLRVRLLPLPLALSQGAAGLMENAWKLSGAAGEPPLTKYGLSLLSYDQTLDLSKARRLLDYAPVVSLREALRTTIEALEKSGPVAQ